MDNPQVYLGTVRHAANTSPSAIAKQLVVHSVQLTSLGLQGDEQADNKYHGGVDRALCHYPREHYRYWQQYYPSQADRFHPAALGENISTLGVTEDQVFIGDIYRWNDAVIQVTQPRAPCYKIDQTLNCPAIAQQMQHSGRCGWLYRVLNPGTVSAKYPLVPVSRHSDMSIAQAITILFHQPFDPKAYHHLMDCKGLAVCWIHILQQRLLHGTIEEMGSRLQGRQPHGPSL